MTMDKNLGQREYDKFVESESGSTAIRVKTVDNSDPMTLDRAQFEELLHLNRKIIEVLEKIEFHLSLGSGNEL